MAVKIRLMRIGAKKRPFYRVVAVNERSKRTGGYLELLGTYNPLTEPKDIILKKDRIDWWRKNGAMPSEGYLRILGEAAKRPVRAPRKQKGKITVDQTKSDQVEAATQEPVKSEQPTKQQPEISESPTDVVEQPTIKSEVVEENKETLENEKG